MDVTDVDAERIHTLSIEEIDDLVKKCFTEEEFAQLPFNEKFRYRILCTVYVRNRRNAEKYTLKEFLTKKARPPEKMFPHISGSPKVYPDPEPYDPKFWHTYSTCDSSSDESSTTRKPTLEELWDASDEEHQLEKFAQRAMDTREMQEKRQSIGKRTRSPKKRGRKKKIKAPIKPKLKLPGKPRGRKRKTTTQPEIPATRAKTAPVTRSQTAAQNVAKTATSKKANNTAQNAAKEALKKRKKERRAAEKAEKKRTSEKGEARSITEKVQIKDSTENDEVQGATQTNKVKPDIQKAEMNGATQKVETKRVSQNAEAKDDNDYFDVEDAPTARKPRAPRKRFVPPPPPPCFYKKPPYKVKEFDESSTNPQFRNDNFRPCGCTPPSRFSPGFLDLTEPLTSRDFQHRKHAPPLLGNFSQPRRCPHFSKSPPPLAPLTYNPSTNPLTSTEPSISAEPSTSVKQLTNTEQTARDKTTTDYYMPKGPAFYVPRTLKELPTFYEQTVAKISTTATVAQTSESNVTEQPSTSTNLHMQQIQTKYRDISKPSARASSHKPEVSGNDLLQPPATTDSTFVPTVQANTATPSSLTYVKSLQGSQPSTSSTFAIPLRTSCAENNNTYFVPGVMPEREKRIQPKRIYRKKFIVNAKMLKTSEKETETPGFRPLQDITKRCENRQNIVANENIAKEKSILKVMPTYRANQGKLPGEIKLLETDSSDTDASAEIKPIVKRIAVTLPREKPQIKVPSHVPCPKYCLTATFETKPVQHVPAQSTSPQKQLRTYQGPGKRGKLAPVGPTKIISHTETNTIEVPVIQSPKVQAPASQASVTQASFILPLVRKSPLVKLQVTQPPPQNLIKETVTSVIQAPNISTQVIKQPATQLPVTQPVVSLNPGIKPTRRQPPVNRAPETIGKRYHPPSSSDDDYEVITIEFPPNVDQSQIEALSSAQPVDSETVQYIAKLTSRQQKITWADTKSKQTQKQATKIPRMQIDNLNLNTQIPIKTYPDKKGYIPATPSRNNTTAMIETKFKTIPAKPEQIPTTLTPGKVIERIQRHTETILTQNVQTLSKSTNNSIITTKSQVKPVTAKIGYTPVVSDPHSFKQTQMNPAQRVQTLGTAVSATRTQIKTIPAKYRQVPISTLNYVTVTTQSQINTYPAKIARNVGKPSSSIVITQPLIKTNPTKTVQALGTSASLTEVPIKTFPAKIARNLGTPSSSIAIIQPQIKTNPTKTVQALGTSASLTEVPIKTFPAKIVRNLGTPSSSIAITQSQMKTNPTQTVQALGTSTSLTEVPIKTFPAEIGPVPVTPTSTLQLKNKPRHQLVKKDAFQIKGVQESSKVIKGSVGVAQRKKIATVSANTTQCQSGTKEQNISGSAQIGTRRRGEPPVLTNLIPAKKLIQTGTASTTQGTLIHAKPTLAPKKVAHVQSLLSKVQRSYALSQNAKEKALAGEKDTTAEMKVQNPVMEVGKGAVPSKICTTVAPTPGTSTSTIGNFRNIKILTPIRTSTGDFQIHTSLPQGFSHSTQSGSTRISLIKPGLYQVVHSTPNSTSRPRLYTADEMLAAQILSNDSTTTTSATSTVTTSRISKGTTPEVEETPKLDRDKMGN